MKPEKTGPGNLNKLLSGALTAFLLIGFALLSVRLAGIDLDFAVLLKYRSRFLQGFAMTVLISAGSLGVSLFIGLLSALGQKAKILVVSYFCKTYVHIIRGTPLLVQIYFFYYIIGSAWGLENRYAAGILILSLFEGAYISEIIRGGFDGIGRQNYETAKSVGLTPAKTFRLVTLPILLSRILPSLAGQFASIIKDSSLLSVIALIELTQTTQEISADNFRMFENYIFIGALYFTLTFTVSLVSGKLEKRYNHELGA